MLSFFWIVMTVLSASAAFAASTHEDLLTARDAVWCAWFSNDIQVLKTLVPATAIVISAGDENWKDQSDVLRSAAAFQRAGGKLVRLDFPRTEVQRFGEVAFVYSEYRVETEVRGKRSVSSGRATEVFVLRKGKWINPGWHTDARRSPEREVMSAGQ